MEANFANSLENIIAVLNKLTKSTGDYYYLYDFRKQLIYFSDNVESADDIFAVKKTVCTLTDWRREVHPGDIYRLQKTMDDLISRKIQTYNFNYRVKNSHGQINWINSRGSSYCDESDKLLYVLGRLSCRNPNKQIGGFRNKELKNEIRCILKKFTPGFLLLVGIDNLKSINLKNGRDFGDAVLSDVVRIMEDELQHKHKVYRINGDWFAANIPLISKSEISAVFDRIQDRLSGQCTISGGCVSYTDYHVNDESTLLQYAEIALDQSKTNGKSLLTFFTPENYESKLRELELKEELQKSILNNFKGFELFYQPQIHSETYKIYGAEALLRYTSPRFGSISPMEFVPLLEQNNLIYSVGLWAAREALKTCRSWRKTIPDFHMSINMSYSQMESDSISYDIINLVKSSALPGEALTIEVTESMELSNYPQLNDIFKRWKEIGIAISVDDFGTGYSSLSRLKELAVDEIKIDRCFVREIQNSAYNYRLLSNIIELADSSHIRVCCEGVETVEELNVLKDLHPSLLQGYLFGKPCSVGEFEKNFLLPGCVSDIDTLFKSSDTSPSVLDKNSDRESVNEVAQTILNAENDIFYLSDLDNYQLYYLNPAGQKMFGVKNYYGKKCYKVLHGKNSPCDFCTNKFLRKDSFYIWENRNEYCGRHLMLKDKLVSYKGKNVRLEVALDITKQEYVSQSASERLAFADKIVGYMNALSECSDYSQAVNEVLASVGDFYQADRAYLFERNPMRPGYWDNTFEWCAPNVSTQKENLQSIPPEAIKRWMDIFETEPDIIILNLDPLKDSSPLEWEVLHAQNIQRIIAVPLRENNKTVGFVGIDNPRYCIHDTSQVRVLASFLLTRIRQDKNEHRYQILLQETNQELLSALNVGFWTLEVDKSDSSRRMVFDDKMCQLLGCEPNASAENCYNFWHKRIADEYYDALMQAFCTMARTNKLVQIEYPWIHPSLGKILFRFSGIVIEDTALHTKFKGYCRLIDRDNPFTTAD